MMPFAHLLVLLSVFFLPAHGQGMQEHPSFSVWPGRSHYVAYTNTSGLRVMNVDTGQSYLVVDRPALDARWSPDETSLVYITEKGAFLYDLTPRASQPIPLPPPLQQSPDRVFEWSPDGNRVLFHASSPDGEFIWLYDRRTSSSRVISQTRLGYALWLDDARILLVSSCGSACRGVEVVSVDDGTRHPIFVREPDTSISALALSPDRTRLLVARTDGTLLMYDVRTHTSQVLWRLSDGDRNTFVFSPLLPWSSRPQQGPWNPMGRYVAFQIQSRDQGPRLVLLDVTTGQHVTFYNMQHTWSPDGQHVLLTPYSHPGRDVWLLPLANPLQTRPIRVNGPVANRNVWLDDHTLVLLENDPDTGWTFRLVDTQTRGVRLPSRGLYTLNRPFVRLYPLQQGEAIAFVRALSPSGGEKPDFDPMLVRISREKGIYPLVGRWPRKKSWEELHGSTAERVPPDPTPATTADRLLRRGVNHLCGFGDDPFGEATLLYALDVLEELRSHPRSPDAPLLRALLAALLQRTGERLPVSLSWFLVSEMGDQGGGAQVDKIPAPDLWRRLAHLYPQHVRPDFPDFGIMRAVTISDLNGDGLPELMLQHTYSGASTNFDGRCVLAWKRGRFHTLLPTANEIMNGWWVVGDVDGDGRAEMLAHRGGSGVAAFLSLPYTVLYTWVDGLLVPSDLLAPEMSAPARYGDAIALAWQTSALYAYMGSLDAALQALQAVRKSLDHPLDDLTQRVEPFVLYRYGLLSLLAGNPSAARQAWQQVITRYPAHPLTPFLGELLHWAGEPQGLAHVCARVRSSSLQWWAMEQNIVSRYPGWYHLSGVDACLPPVLFVLQRWSRNVRLDWQLKMLGFKWQLLTDRYDLNGDGKVDPIGIVIDPAGGRDYGVWAFLTKGERYTPRLAADETLITPALNPLDWVDRYTDIMGCAEHRVADVNGDTFPDVMSVCRDRVHIASWTGHRFREWTVEARSYDPRYGPGWETHIRLVPDVRWGLLLEVDFIGRGEPSPPSFRRRYGFTLDGPFLTEDTDPAKSPALSQALEMMYAHNNPRGALRVLRAARSPESLFPLLLYIRARAALLANDRKLAAWNVYLLKMLYPDSPWTKRARGWYIRFETWRWVIF